MSNGQANRGPQWRRRAAVATATMLVVVGGFAPPDADAETPPGAAPATDAVVQAVANGQDVNVVVTLRTSVPSVPAPDRSSAQQWQSALGRAAQHFVDRLPDGATTAPGQPRASRYVPAKVNATALRALQADAAVESISLNQWRKPSLATSTKTVGAPIAWSSGYTGSGGTIAVIDTGVQANHPMLNGRVTNGACFSGAGLIDPIVIPQCPGGAFTAEGVAAAAPCSGNASVNTECGHGTHVAGIAAGSNGSSVAPSGIAPDANLVPIQVFTRLNSTEFCGGFPQCISAADVDVLAALDWVNLHRITDNIVAANLSLGGSDGFTDDCDDFEPDYKDAFDTLRSNGVAPVVASGNAGFTNAISAPACISSAIAVGSVNTSDLQVSLFSNASPLLDFLAPGARSFAQGNLEGIWSSIPGSQYDNFFGTSMAAPAVAGAWAVMREAYAGISVDLAEYVLKSTGRPILDEGNGSLYPLIQLDEAIPKPKGTYHPVDPVRLLDTRNGTGAPQAKVGAGKSIDLQVGGRGGVPSNGVSAVVLNVTYVLPSSVGFVTVWPTGALRPNASNLNLNQGDARPNLVTVRMGTNGKVSLYNAAGTVDLIADVAGWYDEEPSNNGSYFHSVSPTRVLDTRDGTGAPQAKVGPAGKLTIDMDDVAGSPVPNGASAVVVNLTGTGATAGTHLTAYPANLANPPVASNLNLSPGQTRPNLAIVPLDADGELTFYNNAGSTDLIADIEGWYDGTPGYRFVPKTPTRILDTRSGNGKSGPLGANATFDLQVTGRGNIPMNVAGVVMNVTSTGVSTGGFVTVYPNNMATPLASSLNLEIGRDVPNLVTTNLPGSGMARFYNKVGSVHLIGDVAGWFEP